MSEVLDTVWEAYTETRDWEGYTQSYTQISLHRTKEGAEKVIEGYKERYPTLVTSPGYTIAVRPVKLED